MVNLFPLIPLSIAILFATKLSVIYLVAVYYGHVNPVYPYISDAGASHPEAGFMSIILIAEGILIAIFGWIRFKQIRYIFTTNSEFNSNKTLDENQINKILKYNKYGLYFSLLVMFGIEVVAAFRSTEHLVLHGLGAFPAFFGIYFYYSIQTWMSYKLVPRVNSRRMANFRFGVTFLTITLAIVMTISGAVSMGQLKLNSDQINGSVLLKWDESYGGYIAHCFSTISENLMILMTVPFFGSFFSEFKRINSHKGRLLFSLINN